MKKHVLLLVLAIIIFLAGCRLPWVPEREPPRENIAEGPPPHIPEEINQGKGQEPLLRVYLVEEDLVKEMKMEEYIRGVVAGEMEPDWPESALGAQAIVARTFVLQKISETGGLEGEEAHVSTDIEEFQVYDPSRISDRVQRAVEKTRGEVVAYRGQFIRGWFSAFAGPCTALADEGLGFKGGNPPYIQSVENPGDKIVPDSEKYWRASFPLSRVRAAVEEQTGRDPGPVERINITERGPSGRAAVFKVNNQEISGPALRLGLGSTEMRSTFVEELKVEGENLIIEGVGYGHGVGMCQWGARALAEQGWEPEEIVDYFFRDIEIVKLW